MVAPENAEDRALAESLLTPLTAVVAEAAATIRAMPAATVERRTKPDCSAVTAADEASEAVLLDGLARLAPGVPVVSEERFATAATPVTGNRFFLVDPLDGTREYLAGRDEYVINVALICGGRPLLGIVAAPARGRLWRGIAGAGAERLEIADSKAGRGAKIHARPWPTRDPVAVISRSHLDSSTEALLARLPATRQLPTGSALKFCLIAEGAADIYPRLAETSEWDVAAGHALIVAAGGTVTRGDRTPLVYGDSGNDFRIPDFIAWGDPHYATAFRG